MKVVSNLQVPGTEINFFSAAGRHQHVKKSTMDGCLWCVLTESLDTVAANGHVVLSASDRIMNMEHRWRDY